MGCFNIQTFSEKKIKRYNTLTVLAEIAINFDILSIEEVGSNSSKASDKTCISIMDTYVSRINELVGADAYSYVIRNQYAIVYRKSKVQLIKDKLYSGKQLFSYTPLVAYFRTCEGDCYFVMLCIHTSPSKANTEIPSLNTAIFEVSSSYSEPDVICLGDYNADGNYYSGGDSSDLYGFDSASYITVIPNYADTTVAISSKTYDRIELTSSMMTDYASSWGIIQIRQTYDVSKCEGTEKTEGSEAALSDHYPV